jgi:hypothetical protein
VYRVVRVLGDHRVVAGHLAGRAAAAPLGFGGLVPRRVVGVRDREADGLGDRQKEASVGKLHGLRICTYRSSMVPTGSLPWIVVSASDTSA